MRAAVVHGIGDLRLEEREVPAVPEGSIRVRVVACAICGTDLRIVNRGDHRAHFPVVVGHEIAAVVDAVAPGVTGVSVGDRVCVAPGHGCGVCRACRSGRPNVCSNPFPSLGYRVDGGFAEYMAVPENIFRLGFVNPIPDGLSFEEASISEIVACCLNAQENTPVREGDAVLIIGSGPAGVIHAMLSRLAGARRIIMTQRSPERLEIARNVVHVDRAIVSSREDLKAAVLEETEGFGADVIYVCAPSGEAQETAVELAAPRGRINLFGGLPMDNHHIRLDSNLVHYKELFIAGASSSRPEGNRIALKLLDDRKIEPTALISQVIDFDRIKEGFQFASRREGLKVVVRIAGD